MQVDAELYDPEEHAVDAPLPWEVEGGVFKLVLCMLVMEGFCVLCVLMAGVLGAIPDGDGVRWDSAERGLCSHILLML